MTLVLVGKENQMDPSRFRHRADIESYTEAKTGAYGQGKPTWSTVLTVWCSIQVVKGSEQVLAGPQQTYAAINYKIECRYPGFNIDPTMRFNWVDASGFVHLINVTNANNVDGLNLFYEIDGLEQFDNTQ